MWSRSLAGAALLTVAVVSAGAAGVVTVDQSGLMFSQKALGVTKGDVVMFENHDDVTHNISVFDADQEPTDLGLQKPGATLKYKFDKSGRFTVRCSIHPSMKMTVAVK